MCQRCFRYFPTKTFLKLHVKTIHSNERVLKERVTKNVVEEPECSSRNYECTAESTKNKENSKNDTSQKSQEEKPKKGKGKARGLRQQNSSVKPWEQNHLTFKI